MKSKQEIIEEAINEFEERIQVLKLCVITLRNELVLSQLRTEDTK